MSYVDVAGRARRDDDPGEVVNRFDDPAYAAIRADLEALLKATMNHDARREPIVGLVA